MKILILYASFGDGHRQVANALIDVFQEDAQIEHQVVDPFRRTNGLFATFNEWLFEWLTQYCPAVYGLSYDLTKRLSPNHVLWKVLSHFSRKATWDVVNRFQPDVIIQLFPDHALAKLPKSLAKKPLIAVVLTDFSVHSRWFHQLVHLYFLPSNVSLQAAQTLLPSHAEVNVCGIPLRKQFSTSSIKFEEEDSRDCIIISAGGRGVFPDLDMVVQTLVRAFPDDKIVVLCGRNERMRDRINHLATSYGIARLEAVGFTENMVGWLLRAKFAVAKAGGVSIAECLTCGTPMLFYRPLAGQERGNAQIVQEMGAGQLVRSNKQLRSVLELFKGSSLQWMRQKCIEHGYVNATEDIVRHIESVRHEEIKKDSSSC